MIVRALATTTPISTQRDRVTIDSVRTHATKHFPVQSVAKATYRDIVERRAQENRVDFVEGVATALTPLAFYEVAMNKAFRALVDDLHRGQCGDRPASRREAAVRPRRP